MRKALFLLVLIVPLILAACGGGDEPSADDAEEMFRAAFTGDFDKANEYLCEDDQIKEEDQEGFPEGVEVTDVSCEKDGDNMNCTANMSITIGEGDDAETMEQPIDVTFGIDGDKFCGGDLVAE